MNELALKDEALRLDKEFQMWAGTAANAVYNMGRCMYEMKEKNLYKELGYETFESWCDDKYQIKKSQAAKYLSVYQNLDEKLILENQAAGIQKLYMIAQISEEDREAVLETNELEKISVTELKQELERVKQEREGFQMQLEGLTEDKEKAEAEEQSAKEMIEQLQQKIKELENKPQDVATVEPSEEELNERAAVIAEKMQEEYKKQAEAEKKITDAQIKKLEEQLKEKETEAENIRAGFEKKLENIMAASEKEKAEQSTQVEKQAQTSDAGAQIKIHLTNILSAANQAIELAKSSDKQEFYLNQLKSAFSKLSDSI